MTLLKIAKELNMNQLNIVGHPMGAMLVSVFKTTHTSLSVILSLRKNLNGMVYHISCMKPHLRSCNFDYNNIEFNHLVICVIAGTGFNGGNEYIYEHTSVSCYRVVFTSENFRFLLIILEAAG